MLETTSPSATLWGGRFTDTTDEFVAEFTASVNFDKALALYDIEGSRAHAAMLGKAGILNEEEVKTILQGLEKVRSEIESGELQWSVALEDVHMNIESRLTQLIGPAGKKLHTARSRNDQVATDIRLYLRAEADALLTALNHLQLGLLKLARQHAHTIMPGFTHLQAAQPVTFGHHVMAWFAMFERDYERLSQCRARINVMPLGSAALAGSTFPIDRNITASLLGFDNISANSLDAVSDRDFAMEFCSVASMIMVHLSRIAEELILWACPQFNFIKLADRYCTGSSIMPQKKNPDVPELVRGKTGRVVGHMVALFMLMKGQPLAYNKDNQEDKEPLFDTVNTLRNCLRAYADMLPNLEVQKDNMRKAALEGYATATDLADYLVRKQIPFRDAHEIVGKAVLHCVQNQLNLEQMDLQTLKSFCNAIEADVFSVLTLEGSVTARNHLGGTAPEQVVAQVQAGEEKVKGRMC